MNERKQRRGTFHLPERELRGFAAAARRAVGSLEGLRAALGGAEVPPPLPALAAASAWVALRFSRHRVQADPASMYALEPGLHVRRSCISPAWAGLLGVKPGLSQAHHCGVRRSPKAATASCEAGSFDRAGAPATCHPQRQHASLLVPRRTRAARSLERPRSCGSGCGEPAWLSSRCELGRLLLHRAADALLWWRGFYLPHLAASNIITIIRTCRFSLLFSAAEHGSAAVCAWCLGLLTTLSPGFSSACPCARLMQLTDASVPGRSWPSTARGRARRRVRSCPRPAWPRCSRPSARSWFMTRRAKSAFTNANVAAVPGHGGRCAQHGGVVIARGSVDWAAAGGWRNACLRPTSALGWCPGCRLICCEQECDTRTWAVMMRHAAHR